MSKSLYTHLNTLYTCEGNIFNQCILTSNTHDQYFTTCVFVTTSNSYDCDNFILTFNNSFLLNYCFFISQYLTDFLIIESTEIQILNIVFLLILWYGGLFLKKSYRNEY